MKSSLLLALLMLAPTEVVVRDGESLAQVAQRALGDRGSASELKALNGLKDDAVAPGTKLKLPGPDRGRAQHSLTTARNARGPGGRQGGPARGGRGQAEGGRGPLPGRAL